MSDKNEIKITEPQSADLQTIPSNGNSTLDKILSLIENGAEIDVVMIEKMMELSERNQDRENKAAFHAAMSAFKIDPPKIVKDKHNSQYNSEYSSLGNVTATISSALSEHGLSATWKPDQKDGMIYVTCLLTHKFGHSEKATLFAPPDDSGKKNPIQQIKSTISYLEQVTLLAAVGLSTDDMGDDGNGAYPKPTPPPTVKPPSETERDVIQDICDNLPDKVGFKKNVGRITAICIEKTRDYLIPEQVVDIAKYLVNPDNNYQQADLYIPENSHAEIPGEFE